MDSTSPSDASYTGGSIDYSFISGKSGFAYAATPSAPSMATQYDGPMRTVRSGSTTPSIPPDGCFGMIGIQLREAAKGIKRLFTSCPISISIKVKTAGERDVEKDIGFDGDQHTYRVKNNRFGFPLYKVVHDSFNNEQEIPVQNLKALFPNNKSLVRALVEWNRHFQNPPPHWLINFVPKAYLRRGYFLAEEVCEYFLENPDGFRYRVEYEPIGHEWCLVGTIIPRPKKIRRERHPSRNWERKDD
ncbi:hypothetical protein BJ508DRAFT_213601 [Ascobolus immersus RN42]|uniref:Uncharacterized protein n=1 Tax=Ascobolus immersus RN42 TaxID=1160509 RepID=A0A3N4HRR4_ASCIM|nr:hypothetical protein BJ508DRAFT_213601 [Ascobolus immersus RN42]